MTLDTLSAAIKTTLSKKMVKDLAGQIVTANFSVEELIDLTFNQEDQARFRASWILENIYIDHTIEFGPHAEYFLDKFHQQGNLSCMRHFGKILSLMSNKKAPAYIKKTLDSYQIDILVETAFNWLISEQVPVAVKSHCLNILANLSSKKEWIKEELSETMDFLVDKESVAFYAKVKQIRKQLKR